MKRNFRVLRISTTIALISGPLLLFALPVFAQTPSTPGTFVPLSTNGAGISSGGFSLSTVFGSSGSTGSLADFFNAIFSTAITIGAILAVLRLGYAGWLYMGAADMWGNKQEAKEVIRDAVIGLLLLLGIYIILYQINPNLLNLNILQSLQSSQTQSGGSASP